MAGSSSQYSILVDVQLQEESIKKQLKEIQNNKDTKLKIGVTADGAERTKKELDGVTQSTKNLDDAMTDFKKVSDLQGAALDKYVAKLSQSGREVARTGKPNRSEPVCCDGKAA